MNRELKFRAWNKQTREMNYSGTEGSGSSSDIITIGFGGQISIQNAFGLDMGARNPSFDKPNDSYEIMQYTGLKDKNGKEIYEDDIIEGPNRKHWIIKWEDYSWCVDNHDLREIGVNKFAGDESYPLHKYLSFSPSLKNSLIIIGNIYANPELLKVDNS